MDEFDLRKEYCKKMDASKRVADAVVGYVIMLLTIGVSIAVIHYLLILFDTYAYLYGR